MPNYPASLDTLNNPGPTTTMDASGYELDIVIGRIHDILEALEVKLGTGVSTPPTQALLTGIGSGSTSWLTSPLVSGDFSAAGGLNVGSASGAAAGEVKTSSDVKAGGRIYPSNQATIHWRVISAAATVANGDAVDIGASICMATVINHSTGQMTQVGLMGSATTVVAHSPTTTGFTINSDTGVAVRIFWWTDRYWVRNSTGSSQALTVWTMGA